MLSYVITTSETAYHNYNTCLVSENLRIDFFTYKIPNLPVILNETHKICYSFSNLKVYKY